MTYSHLQPTSIIRQCASSNGHYCCWILNAFSHLVSGRVVSITNKDCIFAEFNGNITKSL